MPEGLGVPVGVGVGGCVGEGVGVCVGHGVGVPVGPAVGVPVGDGLGECVGPGVGGGLDDRGVGVGTVGGLTRLFPAPAEQLTQARSAMTASDLFLPMHPSS